MPSSAQHTRPPIRSSRAAQAIGRTDCPGLPFPADTKARPQADGMLIFQTLLADNNKLFRGFLRGILQRHFPFMLVAEAGDGDHALELDAELHPQLVFMDIKLPDRSGLDLTRQFKSSNPGVRIYLVTPDDMPEYRAAARECGADHVIVMGESNEAAIVAMVETAISGRFPISQNAETGHLRTPDECLPDLPG